MTNVPPEIREIWTDLYKLFDIHYKMDINSADDWGKFWNDGKAIWEKSGRNKYVLALINDTAELIVHYSRGDVDNE